MKKRWVNVETTGASAPTLFDAVATAGSAAEARALLVDLCTPAELEALSDRWRVVPHLMQGVPYREIHDLTAVSVTTIGRVARCLSMGAGGYQLAAGRLGLPAVDSDARLSRNDASQTSASQTNANQTNATASLNNSLPARRKGRQK